MVNNDRNFRYFLVSKQYIISAKTNIPYILTETVKETEGKVTFALKSQLT